VETGLDEGGILGRWRASEWWGEGAKGGRAAYPSGWLHGLSDSPYRPAPYSSTTTAHQLIPAHPCRSFYVTCDTWTLPTRPQEPLQRALESGVWSRESGVGSLLARSGRRLRKYCGHGPFCSTLSRAAGFEVAATVQYSLHMLPCWLPWRGEHRNISLTPQSLGLSLGSARMPAPVTPPLTTTDSYFCPTSTACGLHAASGRDRSVCQPRMAVMISLR
jgi:hypothetical protein